MIQAFNDRHRARVLALAIVATGLAGCTTTTTESSSPAPPRTEVRTVEPDRNADADKRARVRLELASLYHSRGQTQTALEEVKLALAARPDLPEGLTLRALIYAALGEDRLAEESFQRALTVAPRNADTLHNYAWYQCQRQRFDDAERLFQMAVSQPQYEGISRTLLAQGACQARAGREAEAERTLSRSYELDPGNPATAFNLSEVLLRRGQFDRARFYAGRINAVPEQVTAQSLWLAARIEHKAGDSGNAQRFGRQLRERFPQSPEALAFERGRFDG